MNFILVHTYYVTSGQQPNISEPHVGSVVGKVVGRVWGVNAGTVVGKQ